MANTKGLYDFDPIAREQAATDPDQFSLFSPYTPEEEIIAIKNIVDNNFQDVIPNATDEFLTSDSTESRSVLFYLLELRSLLCEIPPALNRNDPQATAQICADAASTARVLSEKTSDAIFTDVIIRINDFARKHFPQEMDRTTDKRSAVILPELIDPKSGKEIRPATKYTLPDDLDALRAADPIAAANYEATLSDKSKQIKENIRTVAFKMDYVRDPAAALDHYNLPRLYYTRFESERILRLSNKVAAKTGADPAQIANPEKRTPEQEELLQAYFADEIQQHFNDFIKSTYMQAFNLLQPLPQQFEEEETDPTGELVGIKEQTLLYYFALHDEIDPAGETSLSDEQQTDLTNIFYKLDNFYLQNHIAGDNSLKTFYSFIEQENPDTETVESILANIPAAPHIRSKSNTFLNDRLTHALRSDSIINTGEHYLTVADKTKWAKEVKALTIVTLDNEDHDVTITNPNLSAQVLAVANAVISLYIQAEADRERPIFTTEDIFLQMRCGDKMTAKKEKTIIDAMDKLGGLRLKMDATKAFTKRGANAKAVLINDFYFHWRQVIVINGHGEKINAYEILSKPIMLTYCEQTNQRITVKADHLYLKKVKNGKLTTESISITESRQAIRDYLITRIRRMARDLEKATDAKRKADAKRAKDPTLEEHPLSYYMTESHTIRFDSIFKDAGLTNQSYDSACDNRNFICDALDFWKAKKVIKGYKLTTKGRKYESIKIEI